MNTSFFGVVSMTSLENVWLSSGKNKKIETESLLTENRIKIVHYSDCQQLIIWLPKDGTSYQDISISDLNSGKEIWRKEIRMVINGSIQIIIDTLPFAPGDLSIKITKNDGLQHIINLKKYQEGVYPEEPNKNPEIVPDKDSKPIVYKDGFGNILPDEDLILREKVLNELYRKFTRKVKYEGAGRSNKLIYIDGDKSISFYTEMGGGNCIFYVDVPTMENWEKQTGFSVNERDEILQFIAESTLRTQTSSSGAYYLIGETDIVFMKE